MVIDYNQFPLHGQWEIKADVPISQVWKVLDNSANLPGWCGFFVKKTDGGPESLNATRHCHLDFSGQQGEVWERTIDYEEEKRIFWMMERDTMGLIGRIMKRFVFGFVLEPLTLESTKIIFYQYYQPKNFLTQLMLVWFMKPKMSITNVRLLHSLKDYVEQGASQAAAAATSSSGDLYPDSI